MNRLANLALISLVFLTACASVEQSAYRTIGITGVSVNAAMLTWADYVKAGHATPEQEAVVKTAFTNYKSAETSAIAAAVAFNEHPELPENSNRLEGALRVVETAGPQLVALIKSLRTKT